MKEHFIGKVLPGDGYITSIKDDLTSTYSLSLTHCYQPIIGNDAVSLYHTLLSEVELIGNEEHPQTHHALMNYVDLPLDKIYDARLNLEAIGLLKTFKQETDNHTLYTYHLIPPFTPVEFLNHDVLSELLFHEIGEKRYDEIVKIITKRFPMMESNGKDITTEFNQIYTLSSQKDVSFDKKSHEEAGPVFTNVDIDFEWLEQELQRRMLPVSKIMTNKNKLLVIQMAGLYDLASHEIERALNWATNDGDFDPKEFKSACADLVETQRSKADKKLVDTRDKIKVDQSNKKLGKNDQFIKRLEGLSPKELLQNLSPGDEASQQDLDIIADVMTQQGLSPGVMNVLIHYVLLKTDMKLSRAYLEKIASHWARKNVTTVRQAMTLAKSENKKYQEWASGTKRFNKTPAKKEVIPEWFHDRNKKGNEKVKNNEDLKTDETEDVAALLKNFNESKKSNHL